MNRFSENQTEHVNMPSCHGGRTGADGLFQALAMKTMKVFQYLHKCVDEM